MSSVSKYFTSKTDSVYITDIISRAEKVVLSSVGTVTQTFVDDLKNKNEFNPESQKEAFVLAWNQIQTNLTIEMREVIQKTYGDLENWVKIQIENAVRNNKLIK